MKSHFILMITAILGINTIAAQDISLDSGLDMMLIHGEYDRLIDTCRQMLTRDSLDPVVYYKMGLAYQGNMEDELSLSCFNEAAKLDPDNKVYTFMLAKGYYGKGKYSLAEPLFTKLCSIDSLKWSYAHYLSSIYMNLDKFDNAIDIYRQFLLRDSDNYGYIDRMAFAYLKKEEYDTSIYLYSKSLSVNNKDLTAIRNLAYLYNVEMNPDTAISLLTEGIKIDSADMDLYLRRADLYYSNHNPKKALEDYMVLLSSGDSSKLYLKRIGIGYCKDNQPDAAISFLLKACERDPSDYETCSYLGQSYFKLKDMIGSIYYYEREIGILSPVCAQLGFTYMLIAESQKESGMYKAAIDSYLMAMNLKPDPNMYMIIANLYDNKLNDTDKAIRYYQKFLANYRKSKMKFTPEYIESVKKRVEFLKAFPPEKNQ